jgi:hypothetical protein
VSRDFRRIDASMAPGLRGGLTPAQADRIRQVHDLAAEFAALPADQRLPYLVTTVRTQTSGFDRFVALALTPTESPLHPPLQALLDALVATEVTPLGRTYDTKHGIFTDADLHEVGAMTTHGEIVFPVRLPWSVKPVVDNGAVVKPGKRGEPVYRTPVERAAGPEHKPFSVAPPLRTTDDGDDPWRAVS